MFVSSQNRKKNQMALRVASGEIDRGCTQSRMVKGHTHPDVDDVASLVVRVCSIFSNRSLVDLVVVFDVVER